MSHKRSNSKIDQSVDGGDVDDGRASKRNTKSVEAGNNVPIVAAAAATASASGNNKKEEDADNAWVYTAMAYAAKNAAALHNTTPALAMREFQRFLELKVFLHDTDATKISPTPLMDEMWHSAILDTVFYAALQSKLGQLVHHRPAGAMEAEADLRARRLVNLANVYRMRYDSQPIGMENPPAAAAATAASSSSSSSSGAAAAAAKDDDNPMTVEVRTLTGKSISLQVRPSTTVEELTELIQDKEGIMPDQMNLIHGGKQLEHGYTLCVAAGEKPFVALNHPLSRYGIVRDSVIHLVLRLGGC